MVVARRDGWALHLIRLSGGAVEQLGDTGHRRPSRLPGPWPDRAGDRWTFDVSTARTDGHRRGGARAPPSKLAKRSDRGREEPLDRTPGRLFGTDAWVDVGWADAPPETALEASRNGSPLASTLLYGVIKLF
ncbi:hypothetical protein L228DRAFT_268012 [Xylona heveae TC161]|uniref:Uncharacterized protein n=1 Tax=Xylona heveae (strain CBS 132557 / TC161) TaxID=1328760 RepID=A0A165GUT6_XYLHT|nr:hypothetical protein L228DRAFT_268012 [Xylona heveae TC161]KZF22620.1 hypothetical protein L228DRAFT_268012 [Xylona heveae TC161]